MRGCAPIGGGQIRGEPPAVPLGLLVGNWLFYSVLVLVPFRIEWALWSCEPRPSVLRRDSRILRTSVAMLLLASIAYCYYRFREKPGGFLGGLGDELMTSCLEPLIAIGVAVTLVTVCHVLWRHFREHAAAGQAPRCVSARQAESLMPQTFPETGDCASECGADPLVRSGPLDPLSR